MKEGARAYGGMVNAVYKIIEQIVAVSKGQVTELTNALIFNELIYYLTSIFNW